MRSNQAGFTLIELLIVVALIGILAALTAPFLIAAKASANEASAIGSLKAINSAEASFAATCAGGAYTPALVDLVTQQYVDQDVAMAPKSGFVMAIAAGFGSAAGPTSCAGNPTVTAYYSSAISGGTVKRGFASNQRGVIWQDLTGVAPTEPFTLSPTVMPIH